MAYNNNSGGSGSLRDSGREGNGGGGSSSGGRPSAYKSSSNERISTRYRSPPLTSRVPTRRPDDQHRSRRDSAELPPSECLSPFYRERFGSHSPEDYLNLRISQFDKSLTKEGIRRLLEKEFEHLAPFEIKIVRNPADDQSLAYVNFERPDCAKSVRRALVPRMQKVFGRRIALDPAGVIRDQDGKYIPDRYNRAAMAAADRESSPHTYRRRSPPGGGSGGRTGGSSGGGGGGGGQRREREPGSFNLNQDDTVASRTLFVGNLPGDVRESELRRIFEVYGTVEDVGIKVLGDSNAAYSFILYQTVEQSKDALRCQHNKPMRPGSTRCQIGYGKSQLSPRIIVGGLGTWTTVELLNGEFDRYGEIEELDYQSGDSIAYIRFANQEAAQDACSRMRNYPLGGKEHSITVDFAKDNRRGDRLRKRGRSPNGTDEWGKRGRGRSPSPASPGKSPSEAGYVKSVDELRDIVASTWKGVVTLKKAEYPISMHRVFGKEHLLQDLLRDESGNALKLSVVQRLPLDQNLYQKMIEFDQRELALMIAVEGSRPSRPLVKYLQEKSAAGVVTVDGGVVYVLAYSKTAESLLKFFAPRFASLLADPDTNTILIALRKTGAASAVGGQPTAASHADKFASTFTNANNNNNNLPPPSSSSASVVPPPPPQPLLGSLLGRRDDD